MTPKKRTSAFAGRRRAFMVAIATVFALAGVVVPAGATTGTDPDPHASVAYQLNPAHDGSYEDPSFTTPLRRAWSVDLQDNVGYPVIADGRIFVATGRYDDASIIEARALNTGAVLWGPKALGSVAMLAYDAGRVFAIDDTGRLSAFDAATGTQAWVVQLPAQYAFSSAPTATGGVVYVDGSGDGGTLYAVDEATGTVKWTAGVWNGDHSSPAVGSGGVFVSFACEQTYRFGLDGSAAWHYATSCTGGGGRTAVLHAGKLYVRDAINMSPAIIDATTGALGGSFTSSTTPAFDGNFMATMSAGVVAGWDATGTRLWQSAAGTYVTAPLVANGLVVVGRADGTVDFLREQDGSVASSVNAWSAISPVEEYNTTELVGLAIGDGALAVPAGTQLEVFVPEAQTLSITSGPLNRQHVGNAARFSFTSSVVGAAFLCTLDGNTSPCSSTVSYVGLKNGTHRFSVSLARSAVSPVTRNFVVDVVPPTVLLDPFHPASTRNVKATIHWHATDSSGIAAYQIRTRRGTGHGPLTSWAVRNPTTARSATFSLPPNRRLCVSVRAQDRVGNWSGWTAPRCVLRAPA